MKIFCIFLIFASAVTAGAGMMGPAGGPPGALGPPPFVQAIIASKGMPFGGAAGGAPGALGPPPFVQAIIASKGMPFAGGAASASPAAQQTAPGAGIPNPALMGPPSYIQSFLAAKAAGNPFIPSSIPMGPPPFVQQLLAAKAAQEAAMAEQLAAAQQAAEDATGDVPPGIANATDAPQPPQPPSIDIGPPPFVQNIIAQTRPTSAAAPTGAANTTAAWIQQLIQSQIAQKLASKTPAGVAPPQSESAGPPPVNDPQLKRDVLTGTDVDSQGAPSQQAPAQPQYPPFPMGYPPFAPMPYPMMPFYPIPPWKLMG